MFKKIKYVSLCIPLCAFAAIPTQTEPKSIVTTSQIPDSDQTFLPDKLEVVDSKGMVYYSTDIKQWKEIAPKIPGTDSDSLFLTYNWLNKTMFWKDTSKIGYMLSDNNTFTASPSHINFDDENVKIVAINANSKGDQYAITSNAELYYNAVQNHVWQKKPNNSTISLSPRFLVVNRLGAAVLGNDNHIFIMSAPSGVTYTTPPMCPNDSSPEMLAGDQEGVYLICGAQHGGYAYIRYTGISANGDPNFSPDISTIDTVPSGKYKFVMANMSSTAKPLDSDVLYQLEPGGLLGAPNFLSVLIGVSSDSNHDLIGMVCLDGLDVHYQSNYQCSKPFKINNPGHANIYAGTIFKEAASPGNAYFAYHAVFVGSSTKVLDIPIGILAPSNPPKAGYRAIIADTMHISWY